MLGLRAIGQGSGGVEKAVEELSTRLAARGHAVTVFCRRKYNREGLTSFKGVRLVNLPALYTKHLEAISHTFLAIWRTLLRYDVVHVHATGPSLLSFLPRLFGRKVVVTVHGLDWKRDKWQGPAKAILRLGTWTAIHFPHRTIVVSQYLRRFYAERYRREAICIPNGVPLSSPRALEGLKRFGIEGRDYILYLGRLVPEKGCHLLIEAFRRIETDKRLLIVGETSHSDAYVNRLRDLADGDERIIFAGALHGDDKDEAYTGAACLAFPSTLEGLPIVLLEALGYGCPVVCSDIPENLEVVYPEADSAAPSPSAGECPYAQLFPSGSTDELRAALESVLGDPETARARAARAQAYVRQAFSWDHITEQTEGVYASLYGGG